jgi:hypothetical protein
MTWALVADDLLVAHALMISCLRQREHRHGCSDEGRRPREGTLGAGRPLSLTARGPTAFVVGLIAGIIRVAALLVEEWLRAVEFALELMYSGAPLLKVMR